MGHVKPSRLIGVLGIRKSARFPAANPFATLLQHFGRCVVLKIRDEANKLLNELVDLDQYLSEQLEWDFLSPDESLVSAVKRLVSGYEADVVMCREQLAQETERAEKAVKEATSPGSPLVQQANTYCRILGHPAIYTHTGLHRGRPMCMSDQIIARLDELAEAESERDEWRDRAESHALTEPDSTNPAHWRFAADVVASADGFSRFRSDDTLVAVHLRREADRLEAARHLPSDLCGDLGPDSLVKCTRPHGHDGDHWHTGLDGKSRAWAYACADIEPDSLVRCQRPKGHPGDHRYEDRYGNGIGWQADADEELIEKAARTLAFAVERNDDDVSESEMWGMYLTPESRFRYRNQASALLAANLLRDGDQKAESGPTVEGGISNGQLLAMEPERREEVIASLSLEVRRKLANIASLGASRLISSVIADRDDWRTRNRMTSARDFTDLAANLLRDGGEHA